MWFEFYVAAALCVLALYGVGVVLMRALNMSWTIAVCAAPVASVALYASIPVALDALGIGCSLLTVVLPSLAVATLAYVSLAPWRRRRAPLDVAPLAPVRIRNRTLSFNKVALVCYLVPACVVALALFVGTLPQPNVVNCQYDNQTHINAVRAFLDTGRWSTLKVGSFLSSALNAQPYHSVGGSFYPAAWHDLVAITCLCANTSVPIATNAVVLALTTTAHPLGMYLLVRALFPTERRTILAGALLTSGIATWPWIYLVKGPRYPNLLGLVLMASVLAVVIWAIESRSLRKFLPSFCVFCLLSMVALAIAHPNTLFSAYVVLACYGGHVVWRATTELPAPKRAVLRVVYTSAIAGPWILLYRLPMFTQVLGYRWGEHAGLPKTLFSLVAFTFSLAVIQLAPAFVCWLGAGICLRRKEVWIVLPLAFFCVCFVATRMGWEDVKYWLAGMWYQSPDRFAALISMWAIPLGSVGLASCLEWVCAHVGKRLGAHALASAQTTSYKVATIALALFCSLNYAPMLVALPRGVNAGFAFGRMRSLFERIVGTIQEHMYSPKEMEFVDKVVATIPPGALVLNQPNDGSMYAYGANRLNTYFRSTRSDSAQTDTAKTIRLHLNKLATRQDVQDAVRSTGAEYLLLLDKGVPLNRATKTQWMKQYRSEDVWKKWQGINAVDDNTPGFEIVLAEDDDLRLYKIVAP